MALIRRVSRLFAADMHAVLDQIEEPEIVLRQAIREMDEQLARERQREHWLAKEIDAAAARIAGFVAVIAELDAKLDLCLAGDDASGNDVSANDALARRLVRRKLENERGRRQVSDAKESLASRLEELRQLIASHEDQLEGMRQKAAVLELDAMVPGSGGAASRVHDDDVEIALLREKQARAAS